MILVVYALQQHPVRGTIREHLYSFRRYASRPVLYLNLAVRNPPRRLERLPLDLIVFHTSLLSNLRWDPNLANSLLTRATPLAELNAPKVVLPQDEFLRSDVINDFINRFGVEHVFSVAPASQWPVIYNGVDRDRVSFSTVLTGYLEPQTVDTIDAVVADTPDRDIDVGYRAFHAPFWLGRHGQLKTGIADRFREAARANGLKADISTRAEDTLYGRSWLQFMARSKYTIGVEGGASVIDRDGSIRACAEGFVAQHPDATFEQVEAHCFPGRDGELDLLAISPRHLEACAARTCQVLVEGEYNGILEPGRHYIPLRRDFSNLELVLDEMQRDERRREIADAAYRDVVASGRWTYRTFVEQVERESGLGAAPASVSRSVGARDRIADQVSWGRVWGRARVAPRAQAVVDRVAAIAVRVLPRPVVRALRRLRG